MNSSHEPLETNVHGWERGASLGGGLALLGAGLRHGGLLGVLGAAVGGLLLLRGASGHCELKRVLQERQGHAEGDGRERYAHMPLDSETHSPDFATESALPDSTPMGVETAGQPPRA